MKILEHTSTRLTLHDKTVLSYWRQACLYILGTALVFGAVTASFIEAGLGDIWWMLTAVQESTLTCDRTSSTQCQIVRSRFIGDQTILLNNLQNATLESKSRTYPRRRNVNSYNGSTITTTDYWILLHTQAGPIRLTVKDSWREYEQQAIVNQINAFITNPNQPVLRVQQQEADLGWWPAMLLLDLICLLPVLVPLLLMSVASLYILRGTTCTFDKARGTVTIRHQGYRLFGRINFFEPEVIQCAIEDVLDIRVEAFPRGHFPGNANVFSPSAAQPEGQQGSPSQISSSSADARYWNIVMTTRFENRVPLAWVPTLGTSENRVPLIWIATEGREDKQVTVHRIRQFLSLEALSQ